MEHLSVYEKQNTEYVSTQNKANFKNPGSLTSGLDRIRGRPSWAPVCEKIATLCRGGRMGDQISCFCAGRHPGNSQRLIE